MDRWRAYRQAGRARNEPGQEIRFLGGSAVGTGLQSTAAWGTGRSKARRKGGEGETGTALSSQCRVRAGLGE
ncbi:hypothetical protein PBY51_013497 [Eleginops maclovinus]|uniref:Uncharacterized protein n=1 Tax=Eleginops maclovinus TaxID=56733 RepID=A0AAN7Y5W7_ELEMC|nr:hypothetical protein PBY51_013497 [Eleginops maclovinus]